MSTLNRGDEQQEVRKPGQARSFIPESNGDLNREVVLRVILACSNRADYILEHSLQRVVRTCQRYTFEVGVRRENPHTPRIFPLPRICVLRTCPGLDADG